MDTLVVTTYEVFAVYGYDSLETVTGVAVQFFLSFN